MELRSRVGLVFVVMGCFLAGTVALDTFGETLFPVTTGPLEITPGTFLDQVFLKSGFQYGPQTWRPGYDPLGIEPGEEVPGNGTWYLMFIDTNTTPVTGNPNVKKVGSVRITYNFTDLAGRAVFHVYGLVNSSSMPTRTNRQSGTKYCAFVVTGTAPPGSSMPSATPLTFPSTHQYRIAIANNQIADIQGMTATTREFHFNQPGAGQGALHLTGDISKPVGGLTETTELNGTFFVTATGGDAGNDLLLLVAADRPQPETFALRVRSEFVRTQ